MGRVSRIFGRVGNVCSFGRFPARTKPRRSPVVEPLESLSLMTAIPSSWFSANLHNVAIETMAFNDWTTNSHSLSRADVVNILETVAASTTVSASQRADLKTLSTNSAALGMAPAVQNLLSKTVGYNLANKDYQGQALLSSGQLAAGSTGTELGDLVNKWFLGLDYPGLSTYVINNDDASYVQAKGTLYGPNNRPEVTDIEQGDLGDCYFLSSLGAIAGKDPQAIESMIQSNGNGIYTVRFYDGKAPDYVTVNSEFPVNSSDLLVYADYGLSAASPENVLWPAIIEKAYAQLSAEGWSRAYAAASQDPTWWNQNNYRSLALGNPGYSMHQITGLPIDRSQITTPPSSTQMQTLISDLSAGDPITLSTTGRQSLRHNIVQDHVYMLLSYDAKTKQFDILNPYNDGNAVPKDKQRQLFLTWSKVVHNYAA